MNEKWQIGDLAECIVDGWERPGYPPFIGPLPQLGGTYLVTRVDNFGRLVLSFPEFGSATFWASAFKKVKPKGVDRLVSRHETVCA